MRSIKVNGSGEMISRFELDKRLKNHSIEPGTPLHSPKHGRLTVQAGEMIDDPYVVANEAGEVV